MIKRLAVPLAASGALLALSGTAVALPPFTTAAKTAGGSGGQAELFGVAAACHQGFDRFVFSARFGTPSYDVRYVNSIVADGSGNPVSLLGTKRIRVRIRNARGHTNTGANLIPRAVTPRCSNLRQVKTAGDFEGDVTFGLGLSRTKGFRVFRLTGPTRLVVDIRH
jgi:hypothetical protein